MLTKYFSKATVKFTAVGKSSKLARVFMASIPPTARNTIQVSHTVLPEGSPVKPVISVTFNGNVISIDPLTIGSTLDMTQTFDRYSRKLKIKDDISDA